MPSPVNPYREEAMKQYFDTLPPFVQENIMQAGSVQTLEELQKCAQALLKKQEQNGGTFPLA